MFSASNLVVSAWEGDVLVGVSRSLTDDNYCCYLSDLAVDRSFQRRGIGGKLVQCTRSEIGEGVTLVLVAAAGAMSYYPQLGFTKAEGAFLIRRLR